MTLKKEHIVEYIALINLQFPNAYKLESERDRIMLVNLWFEGLKAYPKELCDVAVRNSIFKAEFAPKIATIIAEADNLIGSQGHCDTGLWAELKSGLMAISREIPYASSRYDTVVHEETGLTTAGEARRKIARVYDSLPLEVKEYCGGMSGFMDLAQVDEEELQYEKGRFLKQVPILRERVKTRQNMPQQLADIINGLVEGNRQKLIGVKK